MGYLCPVYLLILTSFFAQSLVKVLKDKPEYPYLDELKAGVAASKRITDKINEAQRRAENLATVKNLERRVEDWKGHHISNFGNLLLDDIFTVTKSDMDREYHVFLFEKIILCCKEFNPQAPNGKKVSKSNSILKKPNTPTPSTPGGSSSRKKDTPLLLKGRIFLNNVTSTQPKCNAGSSSPYRSLDCLIQLTVSLRRSILVGCVLEGRRRSRILHSPMPERGAAATMGDATQSSHPRSGRS